MSVLPPGATVLSYTIERPLGQGGFGITYEARNRVMRRSVALKEMFMNGMAERQPDGSVKWDPEFADTIRWALDLFERTTGDLAELDHPNIVRVLEYLPANNTGYMIMQLITGETLTKWLRAREGQRLDPAALGPVMAPVLDAVAYCHGRGLIHRDIKPDNVMIEQGGRPVLIDFGLVKRLADNQSAQQAMTRMSVAVFSDYYGSPEQRRQGEPVGAATDIYALGAILYRAFAGEPPADASHRVASLGLGGRDTYRSLAVARPDLAPHVIDIVDRCLKLRPDERPASTAMIADALGWPKGDAATQIFAGRGGRSSLPDPQALAAQIAGNPSAFGRAGHSGGELPRQPSYPPGFGPGTGAGTGAGTVPVGGAALPPGVSGGGLPGGPGTGTPFGQPAGYPPAQPGFPPQPGPGYAPPHAFGQTAPGVPSGFPPPPGYAPGHPGGPPGFPPSPGYAPGQAGFPPGFQPPPGFPQPPQGPPYGAVPAGLLGGGVAPGGFAPPPGDGLVRRPKSGSGLAVGGGVAVALVAAVVGFVLFSRPSAPPAPAVPVAVAPPPAATSTPPRITPEVPLPPTLPGATSSGATLPRTTPPPAGAGTPPAGAGTPPATGGTARPPIDVFGGTSTPPLGTTPPAGTGTTPPAGGTPRPPVDIFGGTSAPPLGGGAPGGGGSAGSSSGTPAASTPAPPSTGPAQACNQQPTVAWCDATSNPTR